LSWSLGIQKVVFLFYHDQRMSTLEIAFTFQVRAKYMLVVTL